VTRAPGLRRRPSAGILPAGVLLAAGLLAAAIPVRAATLVVGSKNFEESRLLAEMFARVLEDRTGLTVERRFNLAGTQVCFEALRSGAIDLYPEYTGTGLVSILGEPASGGAQAALDRVRAEFRRRWDLVWMDPLGFENAYEIAVPRKVAERYGLHTLSDLARVSDRLRAGFGYEFLKRDDGLPGLARVYGLRFREARGMQQALKYAAAGRGEIDALDVYTTDGKLLVNDLVVLQDDKNFFPPYQAAALVRGATLREHPEVGQALDLLSGALTEDAMRGWNLRLQEKGDPVETVGQDALVSLGLVGTKAVRAVSSRDRSLWSYMWADRAELLHRTAEHLGLSAAALALGVLVALPLGLLLERNRRVAEGVIRAFGVTQTIPSIALLAFMIPLLGVGARPAVVALWIYSMFPILRNTYSGVRDAGPDAVGAAAALGMTEGQVLRRVRLPLAVPVILAGIRTAAVITVGTATLAAFIGAGGLGVPIVSGLQMADTKIILSGAVPAALLAVLVDLVLGLVERRLTPRGLEARG